MKQDFEQFITSVKQIHLSEVEKAALRGLLAERIEHIGPMGRMGVREGFRVWSGSFYSFNLFRMPALLLIFALVGGGATTFAAEGALPGDVLYPVKVNVNETVRGWAAITDDARSSWEVRRAERRLEEAEELAAEQRLDANARAVVENNFERHADRVSERIMELEGRDAARAVELSARFETSLKVHARILESIAVSIDGGSEAEAEQFLKRIVYRRDGAQERKEHSEADIEEEKHPDRETAAAGKRKAAENKIAEVSQFIQRLDGRLSTSTVAEVTARLNTAKNYIGEGDAKGMAENYGEAFVFFQRAESTAQEVKLFVAAKQKFEDESAGANEERDRDPGKSGTHTTSSSEIESAEGGNGAAPSPGFHGQGEVEIKRDKSGEGRDGRGATGRIRIELDF